MVFVRKAQTFEEKTRRKAQSTQAEAFGGPQAQNTRERCKSFQKAPRSCGREVMERRIAAF